MRLLENFMTQQSGFQLQRMLGRVTWLFGEVWNQRHRWDILWDATSIGPLEMGWIEDVHEGVRRLSPIPIRLIWGVPWFQMPRAFLGTANSHLYVLHLPSWARVTEVDPRCSSFRFTALGSNSLAFAVKVWQANMLVRLADFWSLSCLWPGSMQKP